MFDIKIIQGTSYNIRIYKNKTLLSSNFDEIFRALELLSMTDSFPIAGVIVIVTIIILMMAKAFYIVAYFITVGFFIGFIRFESVLREIRNVLIQNWKNISSHICTWMPETENSANFVSVGINKHFVETINFKF